MKRFDPEGGLIGQWNKLFLLFCVVALALDPLFLYVPVVDGAQKCLDMDRNLAVVVSVLRSFADILHVLHIIIQFRTAYVHHSNHVRSYDYRASYFIIDVLTALPLPQLAVLVIIPNLNGPTSFSKENLLMSIIVSQYVPRVIQTYLLYRKVTRIPGFFTEKPWVGAAFNFFLYVLATYVFGALWYLFAIESVLRCWHIACNRHNCHSEYLYCGKGRVGDYVFLNTSCPLLERNEIKDSTNFDFGIFLDALKTRVLETRDLRQKILYCSLWGLQSVSSLGQGLSASTFYGEMLFVCLIVIAGLVLYVLLLGNIQKNWERSSNRTLTLMEEEEKRRKEEDFMSRGSFPDDMRLQVTRYQEWRRTHGVELDSFVRNLPQDLKTGVNNHLCVPLLKKVPAFKEMDVRVLEAISDHLKLSFYPENSYFMQEGDTAGEMLFILSGGLITTTTDAARSRHLRAGDFCGEEIIPWVFNPKTQQFPFPIIEVKAHTNVEVLTLVADDLLSVASKFRLFDDNRLQHASRFNSQQWRRWAACNIQSAWRRHCKRKHDKISTLSVDTSIHVPRFHLRVFRFFRPKRETQTHKAQVSPPEMLQIIIQSEPSQRNLDDATMVSPKLAFMRHLGVKF